MQVESFILEGEQIALCDLLKLTGHAHSGGAAKMMIAEGAVRVNAEQELRKTRKIRVGDCVESEKFSFKIKVLK